MNKIDKWLNTKSTRDVDLPIPYYSIYREDAYYLSPKIDSDLRSSDNNGRNSNSNETKLLYTDHIYIDPETNRYHANMLLRMMIDYAYESKFDYTLKNPETKEIYVRFNLMDKQLKNVFYKFCYENT